MKTNQKRFATPIALASAIAGLIATAQLPADGSRDSRCGRVFAINGQNQLLRLDVKAETLCKMDDDDDSGGKIGIKSRRQITGLTAGDVLVGIDFRPVGLNGLNQLYGLGTGGGVSGSSQLYTINTDTGVASLVGARNVTPLLLGTSFGFDFNPVPDRIRVVSNQGQNFRLNPNNGLTAGIDTNLAYAAGDPNVLGMPAVTGVAYTNPDTVPQTNTVLHDIDANRQGDPGGGGDVLAIQVPPNAGVLNTVGRIQFDTGLVVGFDISLRNEALAALQVGSTSRLAGVDLISGRVSIRGSVNELLTGLAIELGPECDNAGDGDDDDFDDDGEGDDTDSDDDGDGENDDADLDDDNDGSADSVDADDDNDNVLDIFDNESTRDLQDLSRVYVGSGAVSEFSMTADADTLLLTASALAGGDPLSHSFVVEILDPLGLLVATSLPASGRATATTVPAMPGTYTVRVHNTGAAAVTYSVTLIRSKAWF